MCPLARTGAGGVCPPVGSNGSEGFTPTLAQKAGAQMPAGCQGTHTFGDGRTDSSWMKRRQPSAQPSLSRPYPHHTLCSHPKQYSGTHGKHQSSQHCSPQSPCTSRTVSREHPDPRHHCTKTTPHHHSQSCTLVREGGKATNTVASNPTATLLAVTEHTTITTWTVVLHSLPRSPEPRTCEGGCHWRQAHLTWWA